MVLGVNLDDIKRQTGPIHRYPPIAPVDAVRIIALARTGRTGEVWAIRPKQRDGAAIVMNTIRNLRFNISLLSRPGGWW